MYEYRMENLTYPEVESAAKNQSIILLPISPLEAHGPHLPLGVDIFGAKKLAEMSAEVLIGMDIPTLVAPVIPFAHAEVAMPFSGTVSLRVETISALIQDIAKSFHSHGFKGISLVCQHLEKANLEALIDVSERLSESLFPVKTVNPFKTHFQNILSLMKGEFPELDLHAGEWETAFCLWDCPDLVKQDIAKTLPPVWVNLREKLYEQGVKDFLEAGGSQCYFGDPACGNAELGQKIYLELSTAIAQEIKSWLLSFTD